MMVNMLAWGMPSGPEWIIVAVVALLIWGKNLPEVGRSLGKGITEFKKGLHGVDEDVKQTTTATVAPPQQQLPPQQTQQAFKFDPYTGKPLVNDAAKENQSPT